MNRPESPIVGLIVNPVPDLIPVQISGFKCPEKHVIDGPKIATVTAMRKTGHYLTEEKFESQPVTFLCQDIK